MFMGRSKGTLPPHNETEDIRRNPVIWFLVADSANAQMYVRQRTKTLIPGKQHHYEEKIEDTLVKIAGMSWVAETDEMQFATNNSIHRVSELRFIHSIAKTIQNAEQQGLFDKLALIAPPKMLGDLRKQLNPFVIARVIAELPKEFNRRSEKMLENNLEEIV